MNHTVRGTLAALAIACLAATGAEAATELRFAHTLSTTDTHHRAAERFAELIAEKTGGEYDVVIHPAGALGNDPGVLQGVRLGTIDIGITGNPFFTSFAPKLNVLDLPFLFEDEAHAHRVFDGPIGEELLAELEANGMKGLAFWEIGFRNLTNSVRPIASPDDLQGLKIRTTPNPAHVRAFERLGANPTPMPFTELYLALETGTVDGQENPLYMIQANRLHEVQKHLSLTNHAYTASILVMNLSKFRQLPPEHQEAFVAAAREAAREQREMNREANLAAKESMAAAGIEIVEDVDSEAFREIVADDAIEAYAETHGRDLVDAILELR
jgi:tripartite ATP-independent transporter DctP family solute receptor